MIRMEIKIISGESHRVYFYNDNILIGEGLFLLKKNSIELTYFGIKYDFRRQKFGTKCVNMFRKYYSGISIVGIYTYPESGKFWNSIADVCIPLSSSGNIGEFKFNSLSATCNI